MSASSPDADLPSVRRLTTARIPTRDGEYRLMLYANSADTKDHLALIYGDLAAGDDVLVRVHSECFTGDVLGSLRCDCGEQLNTSMRMIAEHGAGILLYLRQEGRGIGLLSKLRAYNLQDEGYDTVDANLKLGHEADERDYSIAAVILKDLGVSSVRLLTNNPEKIESLQHFDLAVTERVPLHPRLNEHNAQYLQTKVNRMRHMLDLEQSPGHVAAQQPWARLRQRIQAHEPQGAGRPFVTLTYAQQLDGALAAEPGFASAVRSLQAAHDAVLVPVEYLETDGSPFTADAAGSSAPRPIVLDVGLHTSPSASLFQRGGRRPIVATNERSSPTRRQALVDAGAEVIRLPCAHEEEGLDLEALLGQLHERSIGSVLAMGPALVPSSTPGRLLVDYAVAQIVPHVTAGDASTRASGPRNYRLSNVHYHQVDDVLLVEGDVASTA